MKQILYFLFFSLFTFYHIPYSKAQDDRLKGLDQELEEVLKTWNAAGFAVAVVEKDQVIYTKGVGYRDYENKKPVTPNTLFAIGSCSKAFTSSLLGLLQKEDKLSLTDSPTKYIPELKFKEPVMNNMIQIKDLMCHRTGLPRHDYAWYLFTTDSRDTLIERIQYQEPFTGVREQWYYNNFMFLAQGVIAERITGKSWEENIESMLFEPLAMKRSNAVIDGLRNGDDVSFGYEYDEDDGIQKMDYYDIAAMGPAGSINSSVNEMANWVIAWINGGKFKGKEVLPESYVREAMSSQMVINGNLPNPERPGLHMANYGYGWFLSSYKGHYRVEHGGNIDGFSANTSFFPSDSIGIVVLVNQNGSSVTAVARNIIADRMLGVEKTDWNKDLREEVDEAQANQKKATESQVADQKKGTKPSHIIEDYAGLYSNPGYGKFTISVKGDSLFAEFPLMKFWLSHYHYDVFEVYEVEEDGIDNSEPSQLRVNFSTNNAGEIIGLNIQLEPSVDPIEFTRKPTTVKVEKANLEQYVGEYEVSGVMAKVYIKDESTLYVFVPGQPEYKLDPIGAHKFIFVDVAGFKLEFLPDAAGKIEAVLFNQPNGTFRANRK